MAFFAGMSVLIGFIVRGQPRHVIYKVSVVEQPIANHYCSGLRWLVRFVSLTAHFLGEIFFQGLLDFHPGAKAGKWSLAPYTYQTAWNQIET